MAFSGVIGAYLSYALGGMDKAILWLFAFVVADYVTGVAASIKNKEVCSSKGAKGLIKKGFIFLVIIICHGVDEISNTKFMRDAAVFAYAINEAISIIENIDKLGFGGAIPTPIRNALKTIKDKKEIK